MFKYIKTIHSHTIAETSSRAVDSETEIYAGTLCQISSGKLTHSCTSEKPFYLVLEEKKSGDGKMSLDCIRLLPGMVLMATFDPEATTLSVGNMCGFDVDMNDHCTLISEVGKLAEIVAVEGNTVTVVIN